MSDLPIDTTHIFEDRCAADPQGVIKDLISQTTKQAKAIHIYNREIERLQEMLKIAGIDYTIIAEKKKRGKNGS